MNKFSLLTLEDFYKCNLLQFSGANYYHGYGPNCIATDFAIISGCFAQDKAYYELNERPCNWWLCSPYYGEVNYVDFYGEKKSCTPNEQNLGIRLKINYSSIPKEYIISSKKVKDYKEIQFCFYPQTVVDKYNSYNLEKAFKNNNLTKLDLHYTTNLLYRILAQPRFQPRKHYAYEYNGEKYIRFETNFNCGRENLSDGRTIDFIDGVYWFKIEPVTWLVDEKNDIAILKKALVSGVPFDSKSYYDGDFSNTILFNYINNYFYKELLNFNAYKINFSNKDVLNVNNIQNERAPFNLNLNPVSEEEILIGAMESNLPVLIHDDFDEEAKNIVSTLDKDYEILDLTKNNINNFILNVGYDYTTGHPIVFLPEWYANVLSKCNDEPNKMHILYLKNIEKANKDVQNLLTDIISRRHLNARHTLPSNLRIITSMNKKGKYDFDKEFLDEELFKLFAHVYLYDNFNTNLKKMNSKLENKENDEKELHPLFYTFILNCHQTTINALSGEYDGIHPYPNKQTLFLASKLLYSTKTPEMLRSLIGELSTYRLLKFINNQNITIEDIVNDNFDERCLNLNYSQKMSLIVKLTEVDEKNVKKIRCFIKKFIPEFVPLFDSIWIKNDFDRDILIRKIDNEDNILKKHR